MKIFLAIFLLLLFPLQLFASVAPTTTQYLAQAGNDPWVIMARAAIGEDAGSPTIARENVFALAKTILAFVASGKDATAVDGAPQDAVVRVVGGSDLVNEFLQQHARDGQIGNSAFLNDDFWGVLALRAAGVSVDHPALIGAKATIIRAQDLRGGWSWSAAPDTPDTDDTAAAIMALLELGISAADPAIIRALTYLTAAQNNDGGFSNVPPGVSSVDSTAWVAMALQKAGSDATAFGGAPQDAVASRARAFLEARMRSDGSWGSPATTSFAAIALAGKWFPVRRVDAAVSPSGDTLRFRESQPVSAQEPSVSAPQQPHSSSRFPFASDLAALSSKPPLLSAEGRSSASTPIVFPSLIATSIFSKPEKVAVAQAAAPLPIKKKEVIVKKVIKKKNVQKKKHR